MSNTIWDRAMDDPETVIPEINRLVRRLVVLGIKHCPDNHPDLVELFDLADQLDPLDSSE